MRLIKTLTFAILLPVVLAPAVVAQCPQPGSLTFATTLHGTQFGGTGSPGGFGTGFITLNPQTNQLTVTLNAGGIGSNITGAGLYQGSALFLPFTDQNNAFTNGTLTRTMTFSSPALINSILANPSLFTLGVTTSEFPNGAVTGTLRPLQTLGGTLSGAAVVGGGGLASGGGAFTAQLVPNPSGSGWLLNYSLAPSGLGDNVTSVQLNQANAGANGPVVATLSNGGSLTNGQLTGSVPLTTDQAIALMTNPSNFYLTATSAAGSLRTQVASVQNELFIPVAGAVAGAAGSQWATDVNIFNESWAQNATVIVQYLPQNQSNATTAGAWNPSNVATVAVGPRTVLSETNILNTLFSVPTGLGALRLVSDQPIAATARVYNDQRAQGRGTLGETMNARTMCDAIARGVLVGISGSTAAGFATRTNVGFMNPTGSPVQVTLNLHNLGGIAGTNTITLPPFGMTQVPAVGSSGIFPVLAGDVASGAISYQASAPVFAYASINDNASGDTSLVFGQPDTTSPAVDASTATGIFYTAYGQEIYLSQAGSRATSQAVRDFAQQMATKYTAAREDARNVFRLAGITPIPIDPTSIALQAQMAATVQSLNNASAGTAWDRKFMTAEVQFLQQMLGMFDTTILPSTGNPSVLQYMEAQRASVAADLAAAQTLLASLPS